MATEVEAAACCYGGDNNWSHPELHRKGEDSQGQALCISKLVDQRSISFGRYEAENLAWEKFSVFSPNRRREEVEKSTAPGLVAQKKAFFEDYFKSFKAMKGLFKGKQQMEAAADGLHSGQGSKADKEKDVGMDHEMKLDSYTSTKGSVASAASIVKLGSRTNKKDDVKKSGGSKPSVTARSVPRKPVKEASPAKASVDTKSSHANSTRKVREVQSQVRGVHVKSTKEKIVSPPKTKSSLVKPDQTSKAIARKLPVSTQTTKTIAATTHPRGSSLANRNCNEVDQKSLSSSSGPSRQKNAEPENQKPKATSTKLPVNNASKNGTKLIKSGRGEKQEKGTSAPHTRIGRDPKPAPSKVTDIRTSSKANTVRQISSSKANLTTNDLKDPKVAERGSQRGNTWR